MNKQIIIPVLENNGTLSEKILKLQEEHEELAGAYVRHMAYNNPKTGEHLASEAYDCLQVALGILLQIENDTHLDLETENDRHIAKLVNRQIWSIKDGMVRIKITD